MSDTENQTPDENDTEGHKIIYGGPQTNHDESDDTEGHKIIYGGPAAEDEDDDTEGHKIIYGGPEVTGAVRSDPNSIER